MPTRLPLALALALASATPALSRELPVSDGLVLHVDAGDQVDLRRSASLPRIGNGRAVDLVLDASPAGRVASQLDGERRPRFSSDGVAAAFRFDGKDDFLLFAGGRKLAASVTAFVLAAPRGNPGEFSALIATSEAGKNDYTSGFNLDFGPSRTDELGVLNLETAGSIGYRDLLVPGGGRASERRFGRFHVFTVRSSIGPGGNEIFVDGVPGARRDRLESFIGIDVIALGSRLYSNNSAEPPFARGSFSGEIAAALVYERALDDRERRAVEDWLLERVPALDGLVTGKRGHALERVDDPPAVQVLVPGFTVRELPVRLTNLDNVRYRHDGKLVALGYDGRIHVISDTDGDGLEDASEVFWGESTLRGPIGIALLPGGDPRGDGVFVASKGKVSLILDADRDGRAEKELVVASGWSEIVQAVDTVGIAIDPRDGSIYFGLGCANFADPYLMDSATGRSRYDIGSVRGTIQRLSADLSRRETVCTGVRFTCALAFNSAGDLFATDQEGATWCPNGNPLDELLHIEPGKHYGFPPRHPRHLPDVVDEPPVVCYGPQHQSTVGMVFNEGVNGGPAFGPAHWAGDAIVCGESRGKLWRTKLVKTPHGYVGRNELFACLGFLTVDACVSPAGDLVIACHTGPPDWGTGPKGAGRIFKLRYERRELPQPVIAWAAAPDELRVAFDRELDPADWADAKERTRVEAGRFVAAGDRFEVLRPPYQVVRDQLATPRRWIDVLALTMSADRRTLVLRIPVQREAIGYAITLPLPARWREGGDGGAGGDTSDSIAQHPFIDVATTSEGVLATVTPADGAVTRGVLPHPSLSVSAGITAGSADHEALLRVARADGARVRIEARVDLSNPFVSDVQPGSKLDWDMSNDAFASARFEPRSDWSDARIEVSGDDSGGDPDSGASALVTVEAPGPAPTATGLILARDELVSPARSHQLDVPWVRRGRVPRESGPRRDVSGDWLRGRRFYFEEGSCGKCHRIRGEGVHFGPDLSNLVHRDRDSVLADIRRPSAAINPDQVGTLAVLRDGSVLTGLLRSVGESSYVLLTPEGTQVEFPRASVASMEPLATSIMPEGLLNERTPEDIENLLTFLLVSPLEPAPIRRGRPAPPAPRASDALAAFPATATDEPLRVLLCAGPKDHGLDEHDYPLWLERWSALLPLARGVTVETSMGFPDAEKLARADVAVFYNANPGTGARTARLLDEFHARGGGAVWIHFAIAGGAAPDAVAERAGLAFVAGSKFRHGSMELVFTRGDHPITRGLPALELVDESYWKLAGDVSRLDVLATSLEDGEPRPQLWTLQRGEGRVVGCIPGHYTWTFDDPLARVVFLRAIAWAAGADGAEVNRLLDLAGVGARVQSPSDASR